MGDVFGLLGTVLRDQYRIERIAGQGGFGIVYRAHHLGFHQPVAVKCLRSPDGLPEEARAAFVNSFRTEAKALFRLSQHPAIVRVMETGIAETQLGPTPFLVMEWLEGRTLDDELDHRMSTGLGPYTAREAVELLRPAIEGIAAAHRLGFAHRDIKPANLFVCQTALGPTVKVLDFGIAKVMEEGETAARAITRAQGGMRPFSPGHGSPEQVSAAEFGATGPWTDVHALALVLVELLTGGPALHGRDLNQLLAAAIHSKRPTPRARGARVSDALERECARALSLRSADRHADAGELLRALDAALAEPELASPPAPPSAGAPYRQAGTLPLPPEPAERSVVPTEPLPADFRPPDAPKPPRKPPPPSPRPSPPDVPHTHDAPARDDMSSEMKELLGQEIAGFELTHQLGSGGMAVVFRGENVLNRKLVRAVKVIRPELGSRAEFAARVADEALTLERLNHENIVGFYGLRTHSHAGQRLLMMELELLEGRAISDIARDGRTNLPNAVAIVAQAARGVAAAHARNVVHRDLKPDNLFLTKAGVVKVLDFGIAKALDDADRASKVTREGTMPGTPAYMAPEVCNGGLPDARADVYALGVTLLELLLGHHPYAPPGAPVRSSTQMMFAHVKEPLPALRSTRRDAPPELEQVVKQATAKDPAERYPDARALADALEAILPALRGRSSTAPREEMSTQFEVPTSPKKATPTPTPVAEPARKSSGLALGGAVAALVLVGGGVAAWWASRDEPAPSVVPPAEAAAPDAGTIEDDAPPPGPTTVENRWVRVQAPSRSVLMGVSSDGAPSSSTGFRPSRRLEMARTPFEIQQHEVTWSELDAWLAEHPDLAFDRPAWVPSEPERRERLPATGVPWDTARRYCLSLGGTLPTEAEWELAARGEERRLHPWGDASIDFVRTRVFAGPDGRPGEIMTHDQDRTPGAPNETLWDMAGNALEWTLDIYREDLPGQDETWTQAEGLSFRAVRGVSPHGDAPAELPQEASAVRDALCATGDCPPATQNIGQYVGFRCARPSSTAATGRPVPTPSLGCTGLYRGFHSGRGWSLEVDIAGLADDCGTIRELTNDTYRLRSCESSPQAVSGRAVSPYESTSFRVTCEGDDVRIRWFGDSARLRPHTR